MIDKPQSEAYNSIAREGGGVLAKKEDGFYMTDPERSLDLSRAVNRLKIVLERNGITATVSAGLDPKDKDKGRFEVVSKRLEFRDISDLGDCAAMADYVEFWPTKDGQVLVKAVYEGFEVEY